ncbi:hypothetical protein GV794_01655 [Nocardia cyriacigeorgica]|uniref:Lipoprotein LpqS n=1 Tax=Nocardia cyriacigeorgica TaxID=135487 RepID=A0A6P1D3J1_9NOCA|nr:hypothetical protein [Nocardia cyriacigeorgica]NEW44021.1 hypothetical protein [Nocardia cyriacigeorgica]NEW54376.1 hypothetical protein [Nocardia cyriacigeorgica]
MTIGAIRTPGIRVVVAFLFAVWSIAMSLPECHVFPAHASAVVHPHIESTDPGIASPEAVRALAIPHPHAGEPDRHLPTEAVLATLPRSGVSLVDLLVLAALLIFALSLTAMLAHGVRAPPSSGPPALSGRDLLTRFCIARI